MAAVVSVRVAHDGAGYGEEGAVKNALAEIVAAAETLVSSSLRQIDCTAVNRACYLWCYSAAVPEDVWIDLRRVISQFVTSQISSLEDALPAEATQETARQFLERTADVWTRHCEVTEAFSVVLAHIDSCVFRPTELRSIRESANALLAERIRGGRVWPLLPQCVFILQREFRQSPEEAEQLQRPLRCGASLLRAIDCADMLEERVARDLDEFYLRLSHSQRLSNLPAALSVVVKALGREAKLQGELLQMSLVRAVDQTVLQRLFVEPFPAMLQTGGLAEMCLHEQRAPLSVLGRVLSMIEDAGAKQACRRQLGKALEACATAEATAVLSAAGNEEVRRGFQQTGTAATLSVVAIARRVDAEKFIGAFVELTEKYAGIIDKYLDGDEELLKAVRMGWSSLLSAASLVGGIVAVCLARHLDHQLRAGAPLERPLALLQLLLARDIFNECYRKHLVQRLLGGRGPGPTAERRAVDKMRDECGKEFVAKVERTFEEMRSSRELFLDFQTECRAKLKEHQCDVQIHSLYQGIWPLSLTSASKDETDDKNKTDRLAGVVWPRQIAALQDLFSEYYRSRHQKRKVRWEWFMGSFTVRANCYEAELVLSPPQAICLLLFNDCDSMAADEIVAATKLPLKTVESALASMSVIANRRILLKTGPGIYSLNLNFAPEKGRIVMPQLTLKETSDELYRVEAAVEVDRSYYVDATAVRVLKERKTLRQKQLILEILNKKVFDVSLQLIRKRLATITDRGYLHIVREDHDHEDGPLYAFEPQLEQ